MIPPTRYASHQRVNDAYLLSLFECRINIDTPDGPVWAERHNRLRAAFGLSEGVHRYVAGRKPGPQEWTIHAFSYSEDPRVIDYDWHLLTNSQEIATFTALLVGEVA